MADPNVKPAANERVQVCANCVYSEWIDDEPMEAAVECRRFPPVALEARASAFPVVAPHAWCGEWMLDRDLLAKMEADRA